MRIIIDFSQVDWTTADIDEPTLGELKSVMFTSEDIQEATELGLRIFVEPSNLDPWPLEYPDGSRAGNFEGGVADHIDLEGNVFAAEIGAGLEFKPRLGFEQDKDKYEGYAW